MGLLSLLGVAFVAGPLLWMDLPRAPRSLRLKEVRRRGNQVRIVCEWWNREYDCWSEATIALDAARRKLHRGGTSDWLFDLEHKGSGAIGVALLSLPVTIPLSPILLGINGLYRLGEKRRGVSRHGLAILRRIGKDLDDDTRALLEDALMDAFAFDEWISRRVTLEEARDLLATCALMIREEPHFSTHSWYTPEGIRVAYADPRSAPDGEIQVLGSRFGGTKALPLFDVYLTVERHGPDSELDS